MDFCLQEYRISTENNKRKPVILYPVRREKDLENTISLDEWLEHLWAVAQEADRNAIPVC